MAVGVLDTLQAEHEEDNKGKTESPKERVCEWDRIRKSHAQPD